MGNTRYFLSNSREIPVFPAGMGNTHKSRDFANPAMGYLLFKRQIERNTYRIYASFPKFNKPIPNPCQILKVYLVARERLTRL